MKILFTNTCCGHEAKNPRAILVETVTAVTSERISFNEETTRMGGDYQRTLKKMGVRYRELTEWKYESDFSISDYDLKFQLEQGNY